ncbi:hypothetical protein [Spongiactinospora sp. TRM90649]|uniref:hypothetical protein n=1 Tax=Spongiactinospora sp. TRM90649 TaxID=3031114 RepID=UPI0023F96BF1|nr:hypothetical protein [Spongiactinospora sp. TRM90649]MDF5751944.1 hypothetical protein [Spongiactinospora sp. TRM90649]
MWMTLNWNSDDFPPRTLEQIQANHETLIRVRAAAAVIVARSINLQSLALVRGWDLSRAALDEAAAKLGMSPVSDEEWELVTDWRGGRVDGPSS